MICAAGCRVRPGRAAADAGHGSDRGGVVSVAAHTPLPCAGIRT
jgi:hypothetical protein